MVAGERVAQVGGEGGVAPIRRRHPRPAYRLASPPPPVDGKRVKVGKRIKKKGRWGPLFFINNLGTTRRLKPRIGGVIVVYKVGGEQCLFVVGVD